MNKLVKNGVLLAVGGLSLTSCGKKELIAENEALQLQVGFYKNQLKEVWTMLNEANAEIESNLIKIGELEIELDSKVNRIIELQLANQQLSNLVNDLYKEIDRLTALLAERDNEIVRITNLLNIEQQKDVVNQEVIEQLTAELDKLEDSYDELVANPIVITEVRVDVVETIIETQQEFSDEQYNALYLGVSELRGLLNGVIANLRGDLDGIRAKIATETINFNILKGREDALFDAIATASAAARPATTAAWREAQDLTNESQEVLNALESSENAIINALSRMNASNVKINELLNNG